MAAEVNILTEIGDGVISYGNGVHIVRMNFAEIPREIYSILIPRKITLISCILL